MLVGADHGAVDVMETPVQLAFGVCLLLKIRQDAIPDAGASPAIEARGNGLPRTVLSGKIPPGCSRASEPQQAIDNWAMILRRAATLWSLRWKQRPQSLPLVVSQISSAHTESLLTLTSFENRT